MINVGLGLLLCTEIVLVHSTKHQELMTLKVKKCGFCWKGNWKGTESRISWNNSCQKTGETGQHRHQEWLSFWPKEKRKRRQMKAITNGLLCRQFHLHTITLEARIAFCDTILDLSLGLLDQKPCMTMGGKKTTEQFLSFTSSFKILE